LMKINIYMKKLNELTEVEKLEVFNVEELENRLELEKWVKVVINAICPDPGEVIGDILH
jgi:hypothetical protein